ncbi:MAG TPA: ABC transporter permease [Ktedonobacterales bacterium]
MRAMSQPSLPGRGAALVRRLVGERAGAFLLLPAGAWYAVFFLAPLIYMVVVSFGESPGYGGPPQLGFHLDSYQLIADPLYLKVFLGTLQMAFVGTVACLVAGYPLAYFLATRATLRKTTLLLMIIVPFWTSFLIRTYAWETILDSEGVLSHILQFLGLLHGPLNVLYTRTAIFIGIVYNYLPLMVFPLYVALERLDKRLVEASKDLGAGRLTTFMRVTLPLTLPGVMTGCLLVFIPLTGEYLIPAILGGSKNLFLGNLIGEQFTGQGASSDWPFGAALGVVVILILLVFVNLYLLAFRRIQGVPGQAA